VASVATLQDRMVPNWLKVSCSALLSMDLSRFCRHGEGNRQYCDLAVPVV
jgi:hypothetical protein